MDPKIESQIKTDIQNNKILVYMKGTPEAPQCGFSQATVALLQSFGKPFASRDVLADPDLREHVPEVTEWPTFPQVLVNGKLLGGCDIVHEMHERGELESLIKNA